MLADYLEAVELVELVELVEPAEISPVIISDPDDDHVLACALGARADLIVSGDAALLALKHFQQIPIVMAVDALRGIEARK